MSCEVLLIGLNHSTAPVSVREQITFPGNQDGEVAHRLLSVEGVGEAIIFSTCNRSEILSVAEDASATTPRLINAISLINAIKPESFMDHLYVKVGTDAVRHVFRVASSLDSMVVGEPQVLGQVKECYKRASAVNATGPILNRLMHKAFFTAKRVRSETGVALAAVSVAYVAVELAKKILGDLRDKSVLLVGAGEMAELAARHLAGQVEKQVTVVNRTFENACVLAKQLHGRAAVMEQIEECLVTADIAITSTGSCETLIKCAHLAKVMRRRRYRPIFLIDIAMPRDVEPEANDIDGVYLYNIDDLQSVAAENMGERRQEALRAENVVLEEVAKFMDWTRSLDSTPTIVAIRQKLETIRQSELARCNGKLADLTAGQREAVEMITRSIINKIAHDPIAFLKKTKSRPKRNLYLDVAQRLFDIRGPESDPDSGEEESVEK
ncbi:MAG: glutamyl-tRNA reductase [Deltaproteobacteria bacterium]|nr:glutamyl-tRNA reductase [Deltaproteobacteria bacterium]